MKNLFITLTIYAAFQVITLAQDDISTTVKLTADQAATLGLNSTNIDAAVQKQIAQAIQLKVQQDSMKVQAAYRSAAPDIQAQVKVLLNVK